ncbi:disulfide interchange protein DsbD [Vibrio cholerae]|nr:disulfide interchange protein DsbD [Vibrio cholerae]
MLNPLKSSGCGFRFLWHFVQVLSAIQYCFSLPNEVAMYLALKNRFKFQHHCLIELLCSCVVSEFVGEGFYIGSFVK